MRDMKEGVHRSPGGEAPALAIHPSAPLVAGQPGYPNYLPLTRLILHSAQGVHAASFNTHLQRYTIVDKTTFVYIKKHQLMKCAMWKISRLGPLLHHSDHSLSRTTIGPEIRQKTYPSVPLPGQPAAGPSGFIPIIGICGRGGA